MEPDFSGSPSEGGRVLVVDDNRLNRVKLVQAVRQQGHDAVAAGDGLEALRMLCAEPFDVVLLDILMPEMDGFEVLKRMKEDPALHDLPVIVISALDDMESVVRCIEMGAEDYLGKPFNPLLLRARLGTSLSRKRLRDLERKYLQQEMLLRQNEKLATLGRLSAGLAHELNNPIAAVTRAAEQLQTALGELGAGARALAQTALSEEQRARLEELEQAAIARAPHAMELNPVARADREELLERWLSAQGVRDGWTIAPVLVTAGYTAEELADAVAAFEAAVLPALLNWLAATLAVHGLLAEVRQGGTRVASLVKAFKMYSYMDRAPLQSVDLHQSLDDTLVILRGKFNAATRVRREYAPALPSLPAYGAELNQVWTNVLDNAADAVTSSGGGEIVIRTRSEGAAAVVEVEDEGPGIPDHVIPRVFDPFFTTKPPGEGSGLGLSISHAIVQKHGGRIDVYSRPGRTRFEIRLPLDGPPRVPGAL